jgi:RNA polymerase sigma-54 factor
LAEIKPSIDCILHLNPRPGNSGSDSVKEVPQITPDFLLMNDDGELKLSLNGRNSPELKISSRYKEMLQQYSGKGKKDASQKEAILFVKQKIDSAKWFIDALMQRNQTLMVCMEAIIDHQKAFFLSGDESKLKPMILKDIADRVGMDISTISRMANSKYIQTTFGTYLLKYFFSEGLSTDDGEEASSREIKQILKDAIEQEQKSKPLPDEKLMALLNEKGYNIARRTVAKYREQLGIPVARLRKEL